ncbi:ATP-dependent Clp protease proteolytic subunit [Streptomyces glaucus]|uniref:ATP-dependent Clp protease proteolytic subunit n=1 Tax=Streptomyces glaucus TaxID=284029 RepID=A0ABN3JZ73_9ACTN
MIRPSARHVLPESTERTGFGTRTLDPYAKLLEERIVFLGTRIDDTAANDATARFMLLEHQAPDRDISLCLNSPGGSFGATSALYDTMRYVGCDVATVRPGQAGPVAAVLPAAGTPGKRSVLPGARLVLRRPALPEPAEGRVSDLAVRAEELARVRARPEEMLAAHTGRTPEQVGADIERDMALDAQGTLEYGPVDRVVPGRRAAHAAPGGR